MAEQTSGDALASEIEALLDQDDIFVPSEVGDELAAMLHRFYARREA